MATRRLIDAAATLPAAERALLNLWIQRGLGDQALAVMTGMSAAAITQRRVAIVERLSTELSLPESDVRGALDELAAAAAGANPTASDETRSQLRPEPGTTEPEALPEPEPERRQRHGWGAALLTAAVVTIAIVFLLSRISGGSPSPARPTSSAVAVTSSAVTSSAAASSNTPTGPPATDRRSSLAPLPGGPTRARGTVASLGAGLTARLVLTVTGLPDPGRDHYEVWLYNSIIDSRPLGRLAGTGGRERYRLPASASRYHSIDISLQPADSVNPSGESVLRGLNPVTGSG